jgi:hypothetical protein
MTSLQQQQQPDADKAMAETFTSREIFRLEEELRVAHKEITKLQKKKREKESQAVKDRTEREQLQQAARREVTNLRYDKSTLKMQALQDGKKIDKLNTEVTDLKKENRCLKDELAQKDRVQAAKDSKLIRDLSNKLECIWNDNKDLTDQNDRLLQTETKLKEEKEQLTASQTNSHKEIQSAQDFLIGAGAVLVDIDEVVEVSVRRTRGKEQLHDALHDKAVLEARVENFEEDIKNAQEALKKATAIDLS